MLEVHARGSKESIVRQDCATVLFFLLILQFICISARSCTKTLTCEFLGLLQAAALSSFALVLIEEEEEEEL